MGSFVNRRTTSIIAAAVGVTIIVLNVALLYSASEATHPTTTKSAPLLAARIAALLTSDALQKPYLFICGLNFGILLPQGIHVCGTWIGASGSDRRVLGH